MNWNWKTPSLWQRLLVALLIVAAASAIRAAFFGGLGRVTPYLTYYPAVALAALFGGLPAGLLATALSALLCFIWISRDVMSPVETLGLVVFVLSCALISVICEALRRAHAQAKLARDKIEIANRELHADIYERKKVEGALQREKEFESTMLDNIVEGVVACDATGKLVLFNRTAREWHGMDALALPPEEWSRHFDLFEADGTTPLPTEQIPLFRAFRGEAVHDAVMAIVAKGQPLRHILASGSPFFDDHHHLLGAVVAMRDITERKQVEDALQQSRDLLDQTQQISKTGGWEYDVATGRVTWTAEMFLLHGVPPDYNPSPVGQEPIEFYAPEDKQRIAAAFQRAIEAGEPFELEAQLIPQSGTKIWVRTNGRAERRGGRIVRVFGNISDITERKQAEAKVTEQLDELRRWHRALLDREGRVLEMKQEVNALLARLGEPPRYGAAAATSTSNPSTG